MELKDFSVGGNFVGKSRPPEYKYSKSSSFSRLFFCFIYPVLKLSTTIRLEKEHSYPLPNSENVKNEKISPLTLKSSVLSSILKSNWKLLIFSIISGNIIVLLEFSGPVYMELLIKYIEDSNRDEQYGILLASSFTILTFAYPIISSNRSFYNELLTLRVRNGLFNLVYNTTLQVFKVPEGTGVNLLQVDTSKICRCFSYSGYFFNAPLQITLAIYLIYRQVGNAVWVGLGTILVSMLVNFLVTSTCKKLNEQVMKIRDNRMEKSTELLTQIKMIKSYSWESSFLEKIQKIRKQELQKVTVLNILYSLNIFYFWTLPNIITVVVLAYYTQVMGKELDSSKTFVTLTTLLLLQEPLRSIPNLFSSIVQMLVSVKRIQELVESDKFVPVVNSNETFFDSCSFAYGEKVVLKEISFKIQEKEFLGIVGPVGSGKSSILQALMGEIPLVAGRMKVNTSIAYAPSLDSWLLNTSVRENILMGLDFNEKWYWEVIEACCLMPDIKNLPGNDLTEIGERGINLSGGQKARICLARAVYADKDVILLDDPLSSVDNHVAKHIFNKCFLGLLKEKTRVLVTHRLNFLDQIDRVVHLDNGKITQITQGFKEGSDDSQAEISKPFQEQTSENKLIEEEDREVGEVSKEVYFEYNRLSGSFAWISLAVLSMALWLGTRMAGDIFLKDWSNNPSETDFYLPLYVGLKVGGCIFIFTRSFFLTAVLSIKASYNSHELLLKSLLRAPINLFYDVTPLGRILNRLSKDLNLIDEEVAFGIGSFIAQTCMCIACILMAIIYIPFTLIFVLIFFIPLKKIGFYYKNATRELTRLESISRSPILNNYEQTLSGVKFIRSFNQSSNFTLKNQELIDINSKINYSLNACRAWMGSSIGLITSSILSFIFWAGVLYGDSLSVGVIGLCLTYMIPLPEELGMWLIDLAAMENNMVSVERVKSLLSIKPEQALSTQIDVRYPNWPESPSIRFSKVKMRYRPNTAEVLRGLSFEIPGKSRVGITGRTGSGKSSLFLALLRIVELDSGIISIDGVNIALLGLQKLRQSITLIPQDPLLFNGTLRENLDPLSEHSDETLRKVLQDVKLQFDLDYEIKTSGTNLSIGERQIVSLSRALICNTRILMFDETTAGIDPKTDLMIQEIIKGKFLDCTILTIAHRLGTIMDNDLILLLSDGKLKEIGSPEELMAFDSEFKSLAKTLH
jgi:ABC-type multidrug transport system fused ATPase/permease subunit